MLRLLLCLAVFTGLLRAQPSNLVLLYIDNVGWGDLGCYGNPIIRTPNIDRLAAEGVRLTDFYIPTSSCSPSRGALLTGRYPERNGLTHQLSAQENWTGIGLPHDEIILPQLLKKKGYSTGAFGKWNIGFVEGSRPTDRGFDEYLGCRSGNCDYFSYSYNGRHDLYRGTEPARMTGYTTDIFADAACDFIRRNQETPFFAYVPFNAAHVPNPKNKRPGQPLRWQAPEKFFRLYGYSPDDDIAEHGYQAVLSALDAGIGRILDQLDRSGVRENTLVILASDNGGMVEPKRPPLEVASNGPFRGGRTTTYEGGIRTAGIVRWPGRTPVGAVCHEPLTNMDLFVLALHAAGAKLPTDRTIDGRDPLPTLRGEAPSPHAALYFHFRGSSAIRRGRWKAVRPAPDTAWELYDLSADHAENRDLAASRAGLAADMARDFDSWLRGLNAE